MVKNKNVISHGNLTTRISENTTLSTKPVKLDGQQIKHEDG